MCARPAANLAVARVGRVQEPSFKAGNQPARSAGARNGPEFKEKEANLRVKPIRIWEFEKVSLLCAGDSRKNILSLSVSISSWVKAQRARARSFCPALMHAQNLSTAGLQSVSLLTGAITRLAFKAKIKPSGGSPPLFEHFLHRVMIKVCAMRFCALLAFFSQQVCLLFARLNDRLQPPLRPFSASALPGT